MLGGLDMPRKAKELSPLEVRRLLSPGRWSVGGVDGLALQVIASGARSWVPRLAVSGKQREMGLGSFPTVTLATAREKARALREQVAAGSDPIASRRVTPSRAPLPPSAWPKRLLPKSLPNTSRNTERHGKTKSTARSGQSPCKPMPNP